jgi:hypothetical protein
MLKIGPIRCPKFGSTRKLSYLCSAVEKKKSLHTDMQNQRPLRKNCLAKQYFPLGGGVKTLTFLCTSLLRRQAGVLHARKTQVNLVFHSLFRNFADR